MKKILIITLFAALLFSEEIMGQTYNQFGTQQNPNEMVMKKKKFRENSMREAGWQQMIEFGLGVDHKNWQTLALDASYIYGYQVGRGLFVGAGAGLQLQPVFFDKYLNDDYKIKQPVSVSIPFFLDIRAYIMNRKFSPYVDVRGGYSLGILSAKMDYSQEWSYGAANEDGWSHRADTYTKNWVGTGKFGAIGLGINYKKWDFGVYYPYSYSYGKHKYTTEIERTSTSGSKTTEKFSDKRSNRRSPIELQFKAALRF